MALFCCDGLQHHRLSATNPSNVMVETSHVFVVTWREVLAVVNDALCGTDKALVQGMANRRRYLVRVFRNWLK